MPTAARRRIIVFLVLTYALSSIFYALIISSGKMKALPTFGLMWCPGVAALIVRLATQRNLRGTGWGWGKTRWRCWPISFRPDWRWWSMASSGRPASAASIRRG